ncbi:MAG: DUF6089 family protein [Owenweeksia sp.]
MGRKLVVSTLFLLISLCSFAQSRLAYTEYGLSIGTLNYSGDIATDNGVSAMLNEVRPDFGVYAIRNFNDWFAMGATIHYGWFYADDVNHSSPTRGLSVSTNVTQANIFMEANFIRFGKYHYDRKFGLYVKAGGGFLAYNPALTIGNLIPENIELYPNSYSGTNFYGGLGIKFRTGFKEVLRLEATFHSSGSDHMDGFEFTDRLSDNDFYGGIRVIYSIAVF